MIGKLAAGEGKPAQTAGGSKQQREIVVAGGPAAAKLRRASRRMRRHAHHVNLSKHRIAVTADETGNRALVTTNVYSFSRQRFWEDQSSSIRIIRVLFSEEYVLRILTCCNLAYVTYVDTSKVQTMHQRRNDALNAARTATIVYAEWSRKKLHKVYCTVILQLFAVE